MSKNRSGAPITGAKDSLNNATSRLPHTPTPVRGFSCVGKNPIIEFKKLINIMDRLRGPGGCPWDKHQTHESLIKYLFEESLELQTAIRNQDLENIKEELGDILLQVVFHSRIASETGCFNIADVISEINKKLIRRHPHVFGKKKLKNSAQVIKQWKKIKALEKKNKIK